MHILIFQTSNIIYLEIMVIITPLLKKVGLDPADVSSYRPISNLSVMSKLLERLVAKQLVGYLTASGLLPRLQSAYRAHHSTETAVLKVMTDILRALDTGNLAVLTLLDLSAAFDTVDHATLLRRLSVTYGLDGAVLSWFRSYIPQRPYTVRPLWLLKVGFIDFDLRFPAGLIPRADSFSTLHRGFAGDHQTA